MKEVIVSVTKILLTEGVITKMKQLQPKADKPTICNHNRVSSNWNSYQLASFHTISRSQKITILSMGVEPQNSSTWETKNLFLLIFKPLELFFHSALTFNDMKTASDTISSVYLDFVSEGPTRTSRIYNGASIRINIGHRILSRRRSDSVY